MNLSRIVILDEHEDRLLLQIAAIQDCLARTVLGVNAIRRCVADYGSDTHTHTHVHEIPRKAANVFLADEYSYERSRVRAATCQLVTAPLRR